MDTHTLDAASCGARLTLEPIVPTEKQIQDLADAMWQLLDDMDVDGQCVCLAAKAQARIAFEPWNTEKDAEPPMLLETAQKIRADLEK